MSEHKHVCPWCKVRVEPQCLLCGGSGRVTLAYPESNANGYNHILKISAKEALKMGVDAMKEKNGK